MSLNSAATKEASISPTSFGQVGTIAIHRRARDDAARGVVIASRPPFAATPNEPCSGDVGDGIE